MDEREDEEDVRRRKAGAGDWGSLGAGGGRGCRRGREICDRPWEVSTSLHIRTFDIRRRTSRLSFVGSVADRRCKLGRGGERGGLADGVRVDKVGRVTTFVRARYGSGGRLGGRGRLWSSEMSMAGPGKGGATCCTVTAASSSSELSSSLSSMSNSLLMSSV